MCVQAFRFAVKVPTKREVLAQPGAHSATYAGEFVESANGKKKCIEILDRFRPPSMNSSVPRFTIEDTAAQYIHGHLDYCKLFNEMLKPNISCTGSRTPAKGRTFL